MSAELKGRERDLNAIDGETVLSKNPGRYQNHVGKVITDLTPQQVLQLGQELGLYYATLKAMPQNSIHGDMVHAWLIKMDGVPEVGGDPTWRSFAQGLAEQRLWGLVDTVRQRYPSSEMLPATPQAMQPPQVQSATPYQQTPYVPYEAAQARDSQVDQNGIHMAPHVLGSGNVPNETAARHGNTRDDIAPLQSTAVASGSSEAIPHLPICLAPENQYTSVKSDGKIMQYEAKPRGKHIPELKLNKKPEVVEQITPEPFNQVKAETGYYDMKAKLHGAAFIFNNKTFLNKHDHEERKGTERDEENLLQTFIFLGYRPVVFSDVTSIEMLYIFNNLDKYLKESDDGAKKKVAHDSFICCILSHGNRRGICGSDSLSVKRDDIERAVGESEMLRGKPKIFFIQACQGNEPGTEPVSTVRADGNTTSKRADIYVCSATTFGDKAYRCEFKGSWFVVELCKILCKSGKCYKLSDFQNELNGSVSSNAYRYHDEVTKKTYTQQATGGGQLHHDVHFFDGGDV